MERAEVGWMEGRGLHFSKAVGLRARQSEGAAAAPPPHTHTFRKVLSGQPQPGPATLEDELRTWTSEVIRAGDFSQDCRKTQLGGILEVF